MHTQQQFKNRPRAQTLYEIKLRTDLGKDFLVFATVQPDAEAAAEYGRAMLDRHEAFDVAEIWQGMKLVRQV